MSFTASSRSGDTTSMNIEQVDISRVFAAARSGGHLSGAEARALAIQNWTCPGFVLAQVLV
jgi:hypothetical protein